MCQRTAGCSAALQRTMLGLLVNNAPMPIILAQALPTPEASEPEYHREIRREMIRSGMRRKAEAGGVAGCAPVGYINRRLGDRAWVEIDPVQGPLVREAFELMATGEYSLRKLLAIMTKKGLRSRNGKPMGVSGLWSMLNNPFYISHMRYGMTELHGHQAPLVSRALFTKICSTRKANNRNAVSMTSKKPNPPLTAEHVSN